MIKLKQLLVLTLFFTLNDYSAQIGRLPLSPFQRMEQKIGVTDINLEFSRPSKRGRVVFGELVPYNKLWRTGANRNTTIEISEEFIFNKKRIAAGKYALFTIPKRDSWEVILYTKSDNWNVPSELDSTSIAGSIEIPSTTLNAPLEVFTITIDDFTNEEFTLSIAWDNRQISIPIGLTNLEIIDARIKRNMSGPSYDDYYAAAQHQMESGKDYAKGLEYINKAIEVTDEVTWWDLRIQSKLLLLLDRKAEAKEVAMRGLVMAKKVNRAYGIREFNQILDSLEEK